MEDATLTILDVTYPASDGTQIQARHWPRPAPSGVLVISHGVGEHGGCYRHVAEELGPRLNVDVLALDYRGHGRSPGDRGVVGKYEDYLGDFAGALAWADRERP